MSQKLSEKRWTGWVNVSKAFPDIRYSETFLPRPLAVKAMDIDGLNPVKVKIVPIKERNENGRGKVCVWELVACTGSYYKTSCGKNLSLEKCFKTFKFCPHCSYKIA